MRDNGIRAEENVVLVWAQPSTPTTLKLSAEGTARYQQRKGLDYGSPPTEHPPLTVLFHVFWPRIPLSTA